MSDEEFRQELPSLIKHVQDLRNKGWDKNSITRFLIGWVSASVSKAYTSE